MAPTLAAFEFLPLSLIITLAYVVFGVTGFGSSMMAMPLLVLILPLRMAVPLMLVFDLVSGLVLGLRNRRHIARGEALRLVPFMVVGMAIGVLALVRVPERLLLLVLGTFIITYAAWSLLARRAVRPLAPKWAAPFGVVGGMFTALFGTGGPFYTIYLTRRIDEKVALRATVSGVLFFSALCRLVMFSGAGLYRQPGLPLLAASLLPFAMGGLYLGNRLHALLPAERLRQAVWGVLIVGGVNLVLRNL
jgi:uncharacterized membrane protein YfcA